MTGLIVHEWVGATGGAERVVDQFVAAFPGADLQVLWTDQPNRFAGTNTYETWLARTPLRRHKALALPLLPAVWRSIPARRDYEWVLTSSHLFAHHARPRGLSQDVPKYSYVHTPARYIWEPDLDQRGASAIARLVGSALKPIDRDRAHESLQIAANSQFTRARIERAWGRDSRVIYPPVDTARITSVANWADQLDGREQDTLSSLPQTFLLGASRLVPYKRLDLVIDAGEANCMPVVIAGSGPEMDRLRARAERSAHPVHFVGSPSDELLFALYQRAFAFVFPAVEDFGIMPVEAMAAGTPVIVAASGGASESAGLIGGGAALDHFDSSGWRDAVAQVGRIDRDDLAMRSQRFSVDGFRDQIRSWVSGSFDAEGAEMRVGSQRD